MIISQALPVRSDVHKNIAGQLREYVQLTRKGHDTRCKSWTRAENQMMASIPERDIDTVRNKRKDEGESEYVTITVPYTYAAVMASHSYFTSVFLSRDPVYQFAGRHGESEEQVQALEALAHYNLTVGRQLPNLFTYLYDAPKYGEAILGLHWTSETNRVTRVEEVAETSLGIATGKMIKQKITQTLKGYQGVSFYNVQPQRFLTDPAYPRSRFQSGRFCAVVNEDLSWNDVLRGHADQRYINLEELRKQGPGVTTGDSEGHYESGSNLERPDQDDNGTVGHFTPPGQSMANPSFIPHYEFYVELVPKEWGLGGSSYPEKWVFSITKDFSVIFEARPLGYYHNRYPFAVIEAEPEAYGKGSRSFVDVLEPVQHTLDWLVNSHFFNVRAALNNSYLYDPSRVSRRDVESRRPGKAIQLKPAAYGTDPNSALKQLNTADVTGSHLRDIELMYQMGERVGFNDRVLGVGSPSSRRSATEVRGDNNFSVGRLQTTSELFSATGWTDLNLMATSMQQQFYDQDLKLKIVGDLAESAGEKFMQVDPEMISGFYDPIPVDGTLPIDRFAQANLWRELLGQMGENEQIASEYSMPKIFAWVARLTGLKNIDRMKVQVGDPGLMAQQAQQGNVVPLSDGAQTPLPPQLTGMGPIA
jgi:hypothetical protein